MRKIRILGHGVFLPETKIMFGDQIRYRVKEGITQVDMAETACRNALKSAGLTMDNIDLIIYGGAVPAQLIPSTASLLHEKLCRGKGIPAFDVNSSCSSFITALDIASFYIEAGQYTTVLLVGCDIASVGLNEDQKESYELFSDAAAAFIVTKGDEDEGVLASLQRTFSDGAHSTEIRAGGTLHPGYDYKSEDKAEFLFDMQGRQALLTIARYLPEVFDEFFKKNNITIDDIDLIIPHQASKALSMFMSRIGIPNEKYVDRVSEYGNMVAASVPFMFSTLLNEGKVKKGDKVLLCGTAAGLTVNMLLLKV